MGKPGDPNKKQKETKKKDPTEEGKKGEDNAQLTKPPGRAAVRARGLEAGQNLLKGFDFN